MATKESVLTGLEPRSFWAHFETLTRIARPSRLEEPAIEHVREWADRHGFRLPTLSFLSTLVHPALFRGREGP